MLSALHSRFRKPLPLTRQLRGTPRSCATHAVATAVRKSAFVNMLKPLRHNNREARRQSSTLTLMNRVIYGCHANSGVKEHCHIWAVYSASSISFVMIQARSSSPRAVATSVARDRRGAFASVSEVEVAVVREKCITELCA